MTSKGKELYNTIRRSLGSSSFNAATSSGGVNGVKYLGGSSSSKQWIHPPDILLNGRVEYSVKMLGTTEVSEPKGTHVIRDAIHAIRFQLQVSRSVTGHSGSKLKKVDLQINVDGLTIVDNKTKMVLHKYPLHRISFCADDKQDKRVFSFIAKTEGSQRHDCFVFLSEKLAEQITLTIGEAFDLAYQKFLEKNGRDLENQKQLIVLRKRIAELETENNELREKLVIALRNNSNNSTDKSCSSPPAIPQAPLPPTSPIPLTPPVNFQTNTQKLPILEPPPVKPSSRRHNQMSSHSPSLMKQINDNAPNVGKKVENHQMDQVEDLFDDEFDPRANEKKVKDEFGLDPFGEIVTQKDNHADDNTQSSQPNDKKSEDGASKNVSGAAKQHETTPEQFEEMLSMVDKKLAEMRDGFASGYLSVGDTGDSARDFEHTYTLPQHSLSLDATNGQTHQTSSRNVNDDIQRKTSPNSTIQKPSISNNINGNNK